MNEIANRLRRLSNNLKEMKCIDCIDQLDKDIDEIEKLSQDYDELKSRFSRIDEPKKVLYIDRQRTMYKKSGVKMPDMMVFVLVVVDIFILDIIIVLIVDRR